MHSSFTVHHIYVTNRVSSSSELRNRAGEYNHVLYLLKHKIGDTNIEDYPKQIVGESHNELQAHLLFTIVFHSVF